jgi:hypothetical protein
MLATETTDQEPHGLSNCSGGPSCLLAVCVWVCVSTECMGDFQNTTWPSAQKAHWQSTTCDQARTHMHGRSYRTRDHPLLDSPLQDKTEAAELREHQSWLDAGRDANKAKVAKQLRKRTRIDLDGKVLFLASSDFEPELKDRVAASGLRVVSEHLLANIFVVSNPNEPGQRVQWACSLQGGTIAVPAYVASCGLKGAAIEYTSATHTIRKIWISPQFVLQHPIISVIALGAIRAPSSK